MHRTQIDDGPASGVAVGLMQLLFFRYIYMLQLFKIQRGVSRGVHTHRPRAPTRRGPRPRGPRAPWRWRARVGASPPRSYLYYMYMRGHRALLLIYLDFLRALHTNIGAIP